MLKQYNRVYLQKHYSGTTVIQMENIISELLCPVCNNPGLSLLLCQGENAGFCSKIRMQCGKCAATALQTESSQEAIQHPLALAPTPSHLGRSMPPGQMAWFNC